MRYRTKLYLGFLAMAGVSAITALTINEVETKKYLFMGLVSREKSIVSSAAVFLDGDLLQQIKTAEDEKLPAYQTMLSQLRKVRNANRRGDIYAKYLYIVRPDPANPKKFLFVVDSEENQKDYSPTGTEDPGAAGDQLYDHLNEVYSYGKIIEDPWGYWLTSYAPIYDSAGQYAGTLGVDVSGDFVYSVFNRLLLYAAIGFAASVCVALIMASVFSRRVSQALRTVMAAAAEIGSGNFACRVKLDSNDEFGELAKAINQMNEGLEEKERLKIGFAHYVSRHVLEKIIKEKGAPKLGGERRKITVLFADIRGFTRIAETMPPEQVVALLNEYFRTTIDIVMKNGGMLDKLFGDGIMAEFGAPLEDPEQERNAVLTAIEMQKELIVLRAKWKREGKPEIESGIAIHTGDAIVGSIGSEKRMEYTAIGDTVNIASRLEAVTKHGRYPIVVSETTLRALKGEFPSKNLGPQKLPGKENSINAYAILIDS